MTSFDHPKMHTARAINQLADALPDTLARWYRYGSLQGETLTLYFSHPGALLEFRQHKEHILEEMRRIYIDQGLKQTLFFRRIDAKIKHDSPPPVTRPTPRRTTETSTGTFEVRCKDEDITQCFHQIRNIIKGKIDEAASAATLDR